MGNKWGTVGLGEDRNGYKEVRLENNKIKVRWGHFKDQHDETAIVELVEKQSGRDLAGTRIDAAAWRQELDKAEIITDDENCITVRLHWPGNKGRPDAEQEYTMYPDSSLVKVDYLKWFVNIVDISGGGDTWVLYGAKDWVREYLDYPNHYYNRAESDIDNIKEPDPTDAGPLNYHGSFIMGVYDSQDQAGWGRVMPIKSIPIIKLLPWHGKGFELFPDYQQEHKPFTGYIYTVTGGAEGIINLGKQIADGKLP
jgi:hypothetical protein